MKKPPPSGVMDKMIVRLNHENLDTNWWIIGRSRLFRSLFRTTQLADFSHVLEIGPGAGSNLSVWGGKSAPFLVIADADQVALDAALSQGTASGVITDACHLPFASNAFSQILMGDVLEHLRDDKQAMIEVARILEPGGLLVLTVPAYQFLWGEQDRLAGHQRRYRLRQLRTIVSSSGLLIEHETYFNWIMFPVAVGFKFFMRFLRPRKYSDATSIPRLANGVLSRIFAVDVSLARRIRIPFGLSILIVAAKPIEDGAGPRRSKGKRK